MTKNTAQRLNWRGFGACATMVLLLLGSLATAQEGLPDGAVVLDRYAEATGGRVAYDRLTTRVTKGIIELPGQGITFELVTRSAKPNKVSAVLTSEALGTIQRGTNGVDAWETSVMAGPRLIEGAELAAVLRDATFDKLIYWRGAFKSAETRGIQEVEGTRCFQVVLTPNSGQPQTAYFAVDSGLLLKVEAVLETAAGNVPTQSFSLDYKKVDGILIPFTAEVVALGQKRVIRLSSVEHNVALPEGSFDPPEDVAPLLAARATTQ